MADYNPYAVEDERNSRLAELRSAQVSSNYHYISRKKKELEKINEIRKFRGQRLLTLEEYMANSAPKAPKPTSSLVPKSKAKKPFAPSKLSEAYQNQVKTFLSSIDTDSEVNIVAKSKPIFFHHFSLSEFQTIVNKASTRSLLFFLRFLRNKLEREVEEFEKEPEMDDKIDSFKLYVDSHIKEVIVAEKEREEKAIANAAAAVLRAEAEAAAAAARAEVEAAERKAAAEAAANIEKRKAEDPYRKTIMDFIVAQDKAGRSGTPGAMKRAMNLRGALEKYNKNGSYINDKILTRKMKNDLVSKGLMTKGGKRRKHTRKN
jgi:hypothetical protein